MRWGNTSRPGWCLEQNPPFLCGAAVDAARGRIPWLPLCSSWGKALSKPCPLALRGEQLAVRFPAGCSGTSLSLLVHGTARAPGTGRAGSPAPLQDLALSAPRPRLVQASACMCFTRLSSLCPFFVFPLPLKTSKSYLFFFLIPII